MIRNHRPELKLKVFSSMKVYQAKSEEEDASFGELYQVCRETDGLKLVGSIPQPELAKSLKSIAVLTYPNTFPETFCIAAVEAMASGAVVVSSHLGALPETTAGYAKLIPVGEELSLYPQRFVEAVLETLNDFQNKPREFESFLRAQVNYVNTHCTWTNRAEELEVKLEEGFR